VKNSGRKSAETQDRENGKRAATNCRDAFPAKTATHPLSRFQIRVPAGVGFFNQAKRIPQTSTSWVA